MDLLLQINEKNISYSDTGTGSVLVFLHGWGVSKETYQGLIEILSKKYRCVNIDLPGFGKSDIVDHLTLQKISKIIETVVKKLEIRKFNLVGHSLGGAVALVFASSHLDYINKVVLISPFVSFKQFSKSAFYIIKNFFYSQLFCP